MNKVENSLRGVAGAFLLICTFMYHYHSHYWIYVMAFIGLNLFQSAFTKWCPMMTILKKVYKIN